MTKIPILLAGVVVLLLCLRLVVQGLRTDGGTVTPDDFAKARLALDSMLVKTAAIKRILSDEDLRFIFRSGSTEIRRLFLKERKMLALHWIRTLQKQVAYLMHVHLRLAASTHLSPTSELKLSAQYVAFVLVSNCLVAFFWLFGPFNAQRVLGYIVLVLERFFSTFQAHLERVNPAQLGISRESLVH